MLRQRVLTALVALAVLLLVLFAVPEIVARLVIALLVLAGAWEWSAFLRGGERGIRVTYVGLVAVLLALVAWQMPRYNALVFEVALAWWAAALVWVFFFPTPIPTLVRWLGGVLVLVPLYLALIALYSLHPAVLLAALLVVWAADTGAFVIGKLFGRVKLAPRISPGKTWEGVIGGLATVALLTLAWSLWSGGHTATAVPFCMAVASASIIGDLTVSMFKRTVGLKDSGRLFPGHGGVLDRIDSVAAAAPLFALGIGWTGLQ